MREKLLQLLSDKRRFGVTNELLANEILILFGVSVPKGTLCQHDRSVTNRICDDCGSMITYVPDEDLA